MSKRKNILILGIIILITGIILSKTILSKNYFVAFLIICVSVIIIFISNFESKEIIVEKIVLISLLSSISSVGRIIFAFVPGIQPSSFVIIISGMCFGKEIGMMTGIITALASNLMLGHGSWTIPQMLCWGLMGFFAGIFRKTLIKFKSIRIIYGFVWGFLFGWIMNLWYIVDNSFITYILSCITSFPFEILHALSNAFLLFLFGNKFIKNFKRVSEKYGV